MGFLYKNNKLISGFTASAHDWLSLSEQKGVYSASRTVGFLSIFCFDNHIDRLVANFNGVTASQNNCQEKTEIKRENLFPIVKSAVGYALSEYYLDKEKKNELKVTILLDLNQDIYVHLEPYLYENVFQYSSVGVQNFNKEQKFKDTEWPKVRMQFEEGMKKHKFEEIILRDDEWGLYEGLSSNVWVFQHGKLYTNTSKSIRGTIQNVIFDICKDKGISIVEESPNLKEIDNFDEIFITSTSRIVRGITHIYSNTTQEYGACCHIVEKENSISEMLYNEVYLKMEALSVKCVE